MTRPDLILVGGGLANVLIAMRLAEAQPELDILLLERGERLGGNHTWSFHGSDLTEAEREWIEPMVEYAWDGYDVSFPGRRRTLPGQYFSMTSERLHELACAKLGTAIRTGVGVVEINENSVLLADGERIDAGAVIDGRGPRNSPNLDVRFQKFVGQIVRMTQDHGVVRPVIMDATTTQDDGYRFFYLLPFDERTLLIEDTRYSDSPGVAASVYEDEIRSYAAQRGWSVERILRQEEGVLPITLGGDIAAYWDESAPVARSGLQAAMFHPGTGYSLPLAVGLAGELAGLHDWSAEAVYRLTRNRSERLWRRTRFYRVLNRMLFLAADAHERRRVLERFYGLNAGLIARFYAGNNTMFDKFRILAGKPPVKLSRAYRAVFDYVGPA